MLKQGQMPSMTIHSIFTIAAPISLSIVRINMMIALPAHEIAAEREERNVHSAPSKEDAKVQSQTGMQVKQDGSTPFDDRMEWPGISPVVEVWFCGKVSL